MAEKQTRHPGRTLRNGDGRVARLAKWLDTQPHSRTVDLLCLEVRTDNEWSRLQTWPRDVVTAAVADDVDVLVQSHANECGAFLTARVAWFDTQAGSYWTSHPLRVTPDVPTDALDPAGVAVAQSFSGDAQSATIQTQRHLELMVRTHVGGFAAAQRALELSVSSLSQANEDLRSANEALREENFSLRAALLEAEAQRDAALERAEQFAEEAQVSDKQSNIITLATTALQNAAGATSKPKTEAG